MDNNAANSPLGISSRKLAFSLDAMVNENWNKTERINKLQETLYEYGDEIAKKSAMYNYHGVSR